MVGGATKIRDAHQFTHATLFKDSRLTLADVSIRFPLDGLASARPRRSLEGHVSPAREPLPPRQGILLEVLRRTPQGWSIIDAQNTDIIEVELSRPQ